MAHYNIDLKAVSFRYLALLFQCMYEGSSGFYFSLAQIILTLLLSVQEQNRHFALPNYSDLYY